MTAVSPSVPSQRDLRVRFLGRRGVAAMEDRARSLARCFPSGVTGDLEFTGEAGLVSAVRTFARTLGAARSHDVLWLISQHPARLLAARLGRRLFGTPFLVDTGDLLAESLRTEGRAAWYCDLVEWWERRSVRWPDAVVVRGTQHIAIARAMGARRVELLPDGVDVASFARTKAPAQRARIAANGAVTVGVLATIGLEGRTRLPSPGWDVVECVARLKDLNVVGVIVGDGPGLPELKAMAERRGVADRMRWIGRVPVGELPDWMSAIDIFLHTALNNPMSAVRTTGKLPLLLAAGSAAVVSRVGEAGRVLEGTGMLLPFEGSVDSYAQAMAEQVRGIIARGELERWRTAGPALAMREFEYAALGARAAALVRGLARA